MHTRLPEDVDVFLGSSFVLTLAGSFNGAKIASKDIHKSAMARHVVYYLRANAEQLGLIRITDFYIDELDGIAKITLVPSRSTVPSEASSRVHLASIALVCAYKSSSGDPEPYISPFAEQAYLPFMTAFGKALDRFVTFQLVGRYSSLFGPRRERLDFEKPSLPILLQSVMNILQRSSNDSVQNQARRLISKLEIHYASIKSRSFTSLQEYIGLVNGEEDLCAYDSTNHEYLCSLLEKVLELGIRPVRFKSCLTGIYARSMDEDEDHLSMMCEADKETMANMGEDDEEPGMIADAFNISECNITGTMPAFVDNIDYWDDLEADDKSSMDVDCVEFHHKISKLQTLVDSFGTSQDSDLSTMSSSSSLASSNIDLGFPQCPPLFTPGICEDEDAPLRIADEEDVIFMDQFIGGAVSFDLQSIPGGDSSSYLWDETGCPYPQSRSWGSVTANCSGHNNESDELSLAPEANATAAAKAAGPSPCIVAFSPADHLNLTPDLYDEEEEFAYLDLEEPNHDLPMMSSGSRPDGSWDLDKPRSALSPDSTGPSILGSCLPTAYQEDIAKFDGPTSMVTNIDKPDIDDVDDFVAESGSSYGASASKKQIEEVVGGPGRPHVLWDDDDLFIISM